MSVQSSSKTTDVPSEYFKAWHDHDCDAIGSLFVQDAIYNIKSRWRILSGLDEIRSYWTRNARRQEHLSVNWIPVETQAGRRLVRFCACFFDTEELLWNVVEGTIEFEVTPSAKVRKLTEEYSKKEFGSKGGNQ